MDWTIEIFVFCVEILTEFSGFLNGFPRAIWRTAASAFPARRPVEISEATRSVTAVELYVSPKMGQKIVKIGLKLTLCAAQTSLFFGLFWIWCLGLNKDSVWEGQSLTKMAACLVPNPDHTYNLWSSPIRENNFYREFSDPLANPQTAFKLSIRTIPSNPTKHRKRFLLARIFLHMLQFPFTKPFQNRKIISTPRIVFKCRAFKFNVIFCLRTLTLSNMKISFLVRNFWEVKSSCEMFDMVQWPVNHSKWFPPIKLAFRQALRAENQINPWFSAFPKFLLVTSPLTPFWFLTRKLLFYPILSVEFICKMWIKFSNITSKHYKRICGHPRMRRLLGPPSFLNPGALDM